MNVIGDANTQHNSVMPSPKNLPNNINSAPIDYNSINFPKHLLKCLNTDKVYDPKVKIGLGSQFTDSINIAQKIILRIINDGSIILYDRYLENKTYDHSINIM